MVNCVTFSLALSGNARQQLKVAAFKIPKIGLQQLIFNIMHSGALEKRQCTMVQKAQTLMQPAVLSFIHLHARAKSLCTILINPI
jgi:hypothetical protein